MSNESKPQFTKKQLDDWKRFERIRQSGMFNMISQDACAAAGLSKERYLFVRKNYSELKAAASGI